MKLLLTVLFVSFAAVTITGNQDRSQSDPESLAKGETQRLLSILRDKRVRQESPKKMVEAIKHAGHLRIREAIPDLILLLDFRQALPSEDPNAFVIQEIRPLGRP